MCAFCSRELFFYSFNSASQTWICIQITWNLVKRGLILLFWVKSEFHISNKLSVMSVHGLHFRSRMRISDIFQDFSLSLCYCGDICRCCSQGAYSICKRRINLCVKIAHALTRWEQLVHWGGTDRAGFMGIWPCAVSGAPALKGPHLFHALLSLCGEFLLSCEQEALHFHFILDPTH